MTKVMTVRRHAPTQVRGLCKVEAAVVTTSSATEIYARCAPLASGNSRNGCRLQAHAMYEGLATMLSQLGAAMGHVTIERVFLRNVVTDFSAFQEARFDAYRRHGISGHRLPATTYLGQPPCAPGQDVELQAYAVVPTSPGSVRVRSVSPANEHATVKLIETGQVRYLYIGNLSGEGRDHGPLGPLGRQSEAMFAAAAEILGEHQASLADVVRTCVYFDDIERDHAPLNEARRAFFEKAGVGEKGDSPHLPARPGGCFAQMGTVPFFSIGGKLHPRGTLCALDAYALLTPQVAQVETLYAATADEQGEQGDSPHLPERPEGCLAQMGTVPFFPGCHGVKVVLPEVTYLFVSGNAGAENGQPAGDVHGRLERMLANIESLLTPQGATWGDVVQAVTFLRSADNAEVYHNLCADRGMTQLPHAIVQADTSRRDLAGEMEAVAVIPSARS